MKLSLTLTYSFLIIFSLQVGYAETSPDPSALSCSETFLSIFPDCISGRVPPTSPAQLLQKDLRVCDCIGSNPLLQAAQTSLSPNQEILRKNRSLEALELENDFMTSLAINGAQFAKTQEESDRMMIANTGSGGKHITLELRKEVDPSTKELGSIDSNVTKLNDIPEASSAQQCVTFNEYNAIRIIPQSSNFYRQLEATEFNRSEWDMRELTRRYDSVSDPEEKNSISEKINFLQRNPQIRYIFMAQASGSITPDQVLQRQQLAYSALRLLAPPASSNCLSSNACRDEAIRDGRHAAFSTQLASLFRADNTLDDMTNSAQLLDLEEQIRSLMNSPLGAGPDNIDEYFYSLQRTNGDLVTRCSGPSADISCYTDFQEHCSRLRRIEQRIKKNEKLNGADFLSSIQQQDRSELNLDLSENLTFREFNDQICLQVFKNAAGEELSFFGYQEKYCASTTPLPECSDRRALVRRYLLEYTDGDGEEILSNRASLAGLIQDQNFVDISSGALEAANRLNETPSQLRERFGGLYPRVGAAGNLLPPLSRSGSAGSSPASSERSSPAAGTITQPTVPSSSLSQSSDPFANSGPERTGARPSRTSSSSNSEAGDTSGLRDLRSLDQSGNIYSPAGRTNPILRPLETDSQNSDSGRSPASESSVQESRAEAALPRRSNTAPAFSSPTVQSSGAPRVQAPPSTSGGAVPSRPPVRTREEFSQLDFGNRALLEMYKSSEDMQFLPIVDFRNLNLRGEDIRRYGENVQLLAKNADVVRMVSESEQEIVELTVTGKNGQELTVFAKKEGNKIVIYESLFGATKHQGRSIASVTPDFRVHVKPTTYKFIRKDPNGILLESSIYERILYSEVNDFKIFITSDDNSPLTLRIRKSGENIFINVE